VVLATSQAIQAQKDTKTQIEPKKKHLTIRKSNYVFGYADASGVL